MEMHELYKLKPRGLIFSMNVFLLQDVILDRYNSQYRELRNKLTSRSKQGQVCCYCNHLSSRPVGHTMQKSLKVKLQNAINQVTSFADADSPALFVGGRRRNRKKRKTKNGQGKKKNKKGECDIDPEYVLTSVKPDFEYYRDVVAPAPRPLVTCVDLEDPVFLQFPSKLLLRTMEQDRDSLYCSSESLNSSKYQNDSGCEQEMTIDNEMVNTRGTTTTGITRTHSNDSGTTTTGITRTHSNDSGMFDEGCASDSDTSSRRSVSSLRDESDISETEDFSDVTSGVDELIDEAVATTRCEDISESCDEEQFEEIDLSDDADQYEEEFICKDNVMSISAELALATALVDEDSVAEDCRETDVQTETDEHSVNTVTDLSHERFLKLIDDEDEIIFDLSQLEINNTGGLLSKSDIQKQLNKGSIYNPTVLEDEGPVRLPMDLLIEDDKEDEVLFEAGARRNLNITCNPLYEQTLKEEEDKVSIRSFQTGFKTNFDNVNYIRIPRTASDKPYKESSPLLKNRSDLNPDEIACCVIL